MSEITPGDRIRYRNTDGTVSTGKVMFRTKKPGRGKETCWAVNWDDIGLGYAPVDRSMSLAKTSEV